MINQVHVLFTGYSRNDDTNDTVMRANCSCTLIQTHNNYNIIVDTLTAWDSAKLIDALAQYHLKPENINFVISTHGHSDHIGCNNLFTNARWHIVGACISNGDKYLNYEWGSSASEYVNHAFKLVDNNDVIVFRTPGHTLACVSVIVRNTQLGEAVGVVGDLFERVDDIHDSSIWLDAGSEDPKSQREQRLRLIEMCNYIIPGHGSGFRVTEEMRKILYQQCEMLKTIT